MLGLLMVCVVVIWLFLAIWDDVIARRGPNDLDGTYEPQVYWSQERQEFVTFGDWERTWWRYDGQEWRRDEP